MKEKAARDFVRTSSPPSEYGKGGRDESIASGGLGGTDLGRTDGPERGRPETSSFVRILLARESCQINLLSANVGELTCSSPVRPVENPAFTSTGDRASLGWLTMHHKGAVMRRFAHNLSTVKALYRLSIGSYYAAPGCS